MENDDNLSEKIILGLKSAKTMSEVALSSIYDLDRYTTALTFRHPSPDVQLQGEVIKKNMRQMLTKQQIIMEELQKLEVAMKNGAYMNAQDKVSFTERSLLSSSSSFGATQASPSSRQHRPTSPQRKLERTPKLVRFQAKKP